MTVWAAAAGAADAAMHHSPDEPGAEQDGGAGRQASS